MTRQGGTKLRDALEFADHDAVQIDPVFPAYFADGPDLCPGQYTQMRDRNAAGAYSAILKAAAQQLAPFFVVGGVLVVRLVGPSQVQHEEGSLYGGTSQLRVKATNGSPSTCAGP